jgi:transcriptional regulator with XRE-family HTH domain
MRKSARTRAVTASRFKEARHLCALTIPQAAELLRVSERTVHNWERGRVGIPYAAYKLMRILRGYELPNDHWQGYRLVGDTLWSPEGLALKAEQQRWWSLTCRMAAEFRSMMASRRRIEPSQAGPRENIDDPGPDTGGQPVDTIP